MNKAVFLDRDGTINELVWRPDEKFWDSPYSLDEFKLLPGAASAIKKIHSLGYLALVVSNQPGVAKRKCTPEFLEALNHKMKDLLAQEGAALDGIYYCLHHPESSLSELKAVCDCRKPLPGLVFQAAKEKQIDLSASFFIGDRETDVAAGQKAGCTAIKIKGPSEPLEKSFANALADDIGAAVEKIAAW